LFAAAALAAGPQATSGIDLQYIDKSVRPQDDFFRYANGKWLATAEIPADRARHGSFDALRDLAEEQLRAIIDEIAAKKGLPAGSDERKIADLYLSFMDEGGVEARGLDALRGEFARINRLTDKRGIPALLAHLRSIGADVPVNLFVGQDARDSSRYAVYLNQGGLGLPDRDYYLKDDDAKLKGFRAEYLQHVRRMLVLAGEPDAERAAQAILELETALARAQWTKVENRDPVKTYNKTEIARLPALVAGYDWNAYFAAAGVGNKAGYAIVRQPSFFAAFGKLLGETSLPVWKSYFKWQVLKATAPYLGRRFVDEDFGFSGATLRGIPENRPRWKRGVEVVEESIGEGLGRFYVAKHFPPQYKERMQALVGNLLTAYRQSIESLGWMGPETRQEALRKLAKFTPKIGYPDTWRDYGALAVSRDDLLGNLLRARRFEYQRQVAKLGKPIDRGEWQMTPQTVNAYYSASLNEIVFPAAILQPPFFNSAADDAVNYGGIGAVIGHEISHGYDDKGSQTDGDGNLRDWWSRDDHEQFGMRTRILVAQYGAFSPLPGYRLNGELTLGENIADNSGVAVAHKAYRISLRGREAPLLDGYTGDQRFFMGWAQVWRGKARDAETIRRVKVDAHSPAMFRGNGTLMNQAPFYEAFGVREGDGMYLAPGKRVSIW
jgi:predicted metalloendopeptidase